MGWAAAHLPLRASLVLLVSQGTFTLNASRRPPRPDRATTWKCRPAEPQERRLLADGCRSQVFRGLGVKSGAWGLANHMERRAWQSNPPPPSLIEFLRASRKSRMDHQLKMRGAFAFDDDNPACWLNWEAGCSGRRFSRQFHDPTLDEHVVKLQSLLPRDA